MEENTESNLNLVQNFNGYMRILFIEVLKIVGLRGYNMLRFQDFLDIERKYNESLSIGENFIMRTDEDYGNFVYSDFCNKMGINRNQNINIREMFNSIFFKGKDMIIVIFSEENGGKSITKDLFGNFINIIENISQKFYGTRDFCNASGKINIIYITKHNLTTGNKTWNSDLTCINHFRDDEILCSPLENIFASNYKILDVKEKKDFEFELGTKLSKIPSIPREKDTSLRAINVKKGDIVEYYRESMFDESICNTITYRLCK